MNDNNDAAEPTVILNKSNSDGFLDLNNPSDLKHAIKVLEELIRSR